MNLTNNNFLSDWSPYVFFWVLIQVLVLYINLLDRNGEKSKVIPEEVEKRRSLFWELLYLDARLVSPNIYSLISDINGVISLYR